MERLMQEQFIGLTKKRAQDLADKNNLIFWLVRIDGVDFLGEPKDIRDDRICVELNKCEIIKATIC